MKAPGAEGVPRLDVSREELEALLEHARQEPLREEGYQKLRFFRPGSTSPSYATISVMLPLARLAATSPQTWK
jgi:hypothetical protein